MSDIVIQIPPALSAVVITLPDGSTLNPTAPTVTPPVVVQPPGLLGPVGPQGIPGTPGIDGADGADGLPGIAGVNAAQRVFIQEAQPVENPPWIWYKPLPNGEIELYVND